MAVGVEVVVYWRGEKRKAPKAQPKSIESIVFVHWESPDSSIYNIPKLQGKYCMQLFLRTQTDVEIISQNLYENCMDIY